MLIRACANAVNFEITQGVAFGPVHVTLTLDDGVTPIDLTGVTAAAQVRHRAADDVVLAQFTVAVIDPAQGVVQLDMPATETAKVPAFADSTSDASRHEWDLVLTDGSGRALQLLRGTVIGRQLVTRT